MIDAKTLVLLGSGSLQPGGRGCLPRGWSAGPQLPVNIHLDRAAHLAGIEEAQPIAVCGGVGFLESLGCPVQRSFLDSYRSALGIDEADLDTPVFGRAVCHLPPRTEFVDALQTLATSDQAAVLPHVGYHAGVRVSMSRWGGELGPHVLLGIWWHSVIAEKVKANLPGRSTVRQGVALTPNPHRGRRGVH